MKNALLIYQPYEGYINIGDYIQSLASKQFLGNIDIFLNRERLDEYCGEKVRLIMNGWFMHEPLHWPPSESIEPMFVSFHLNTKAYALLNNGKSLKYFKRHEPIACRDFQTVRVLNEKNIEAYFAGCLTLTLGEHYKGNNRNDTIYFVDPYFEYSKKITELMKSLWVLAFNYRRISIISAKLFPFGAIKKKLITALFYMQYSKVFDPDMLVGAHYLTHRYREQEFNTEDEKFYQAEVLIEKYATAKLVVTSKIHCALPCLSLETPVVFVDNAAKDMSSACRMDGLIELFVVLLYTHGKFSSNDINLKSRKININTQFVNKELYLKYKTMLLDKFR